MTIIEYISLGLIIIIFGQTSYLIYRTRSSYANQADPQVFVDTSVLIDGRILHIAETGFIPKNIVIPRSVIGELQLLADGGDSEKRDRARRGLDVISELQALDTVDVRIYQDSSRAAEGVDERLLSLAKKYKAQLCTIDYNLNKVAQVEGVRVLNVNDLAKKLRMSYLPGDKVVLALTQPGSDGNQAVGHLEDGTMVVVENAKSKIGKAEEVIVVRSLQTAAGRMMFAKLSTTSPKPIGRKSSEPTGRNKVANQLKQPAKPSTQASTTKPRHKNQRQPKSRPTDNTPRHIRDTQDRSY